MRENIAAAARPFTPEGANQNGTSSELDLASWQVSASIEAVSLVLLYPEDEASLGLSQVHHTPCLQAYVTGPRRPSGWTLNCQTPSSALDAVSQHLGFGLLPFPLTGLLMLSGRQDVAHDLQTGPRWSLQALACVQVVDLLALPLC